MDQFELVNDRFIFIRHFFCKACETFQLGASIGTPFMMYRLGITSKTLLVLIAVLAFVNFPCRGAKPYQPVNGESMGTEPGQNVK